MTVSEIRSAELATSLTVRSQQYAWFLGAGASAAANIPTGYDMIVDFKARLFCASTKLARREIDPSDDLWRRRIESHLQQHSTLPPAGDPSEYAAAFEAVFPSEVDRRSYIEQAVRQGSPSFGHRVLASLIAARQVPCIFTTNFDALIEQSTTVADDLLEAGQRAHLVVAALDSTDRAQRCVRESAWPLLVKLHGDYQSVALKNVKAELQAQDTTLRAVLVEACRRFGLIVVGYSGRDQSIMTALSDALEEPSAFPGGVRWVRRSGSPPLDAVVNFMELAANKGVDAQWVLAETFDELAADVERQVDLPAALASHVRERRPQSPPPLPTPEAQHGSPFPALRLSALPVVALPPSARVIRLASAITTRDARSMLKAANVHGVVASLGKSVLAFGSDASLLTALAPAGPELAGEAPLDPGADSTHLGLLYDALVKALARRLPLRPIMSSRGHSIVVGAPRPGETIERTRTDADRLSDLKNAYETQLFGVVPKTSSRFAEGIELSFERHAERWWCVFDPYTWVDLPRQNDRTEFGPEADWRRERWATRRNKWWSGALDAWTHLLLGEGQQRELSALWFADEPGINATFTVACTNGWSRPSPGNSGIGRGKR